MLGSCGEQTDRSFAMICASDIVETRRSPSVFSTFLTVWRGLAEGAEDDDDGGWADAKDEEGLAGRARCGGGSMALVPDESWRGFVPRVTAPFAFELAGGARGDE